MGFMRSRYGYMAGNLTYNDVFAPHQQELFCITVYRPYTKRRDAALVQQFVRHCQGNLFYCWVCAVFFSRHSRRGLLMEPAIKHW